MQSARRTPVQPGLEAPVPGLIEHPKCFISFVFICFQMTGGDSYYLFIWRPRWASYLHCDPGLEPILQLHALGSRKLSSQLNAQLKIVNRNYPTLFY